MSGGVPLPSKSMSLIAPMVMIERLRDVSTNLELLRHIGAWSARL